MIVGISMVRDEADIIERTVTQMLDQVDAVLIADNGSADGTREILEGLPVNVVDDPELGYYQSAKMSSLAQQAYRDFAAEWVVPFDADEFWYSPFGRIADVLAGRGESIATAALYNHVATGVDPGGDPVERIGWRSSDPLGLPKVACRTRPEVTIHQGNHGADYGGMIDGQLVVRHFPYRSPEQFERKVRNGAAAYAATDLPLDVGEHWRQFGAILDSEGPEVLAAHFKARFFVENPHTEPGMIFDPVASLCPSPS